MSRPLGLYVHVPFCVHKCGYCDFNSWAETRRGPQEAWLAALRKQLQFWGPRVRERGYAIDTVFWGGGTPSLLANDLLVEAGLALRDAFPLAENLEWTFECNPETLDVAKIRALSAAGATRLSVGIQSFDDAHLERLERRARRLDNVRALETLRAEWAGPWSLDLMFGLPGQDAAHWDRQLTEALAFAPTHVSAYQLTLTTARSRHWEQAGEDELLKQFDLTERRLEDAGLLRYEVSNFAQPGFSSRHNLKYWRLEWFLGLGPGAAGLLPPDLLEGATPGRSDSRWGAHQKNADAFEQWVSGAGSLPGELGSRLTPREPKDDLFERLMMGLRIQEGLPIVSLVPWAVAGEAEVRSMLSKTQLNEFIVVDEGRLKVNAAGLRILDSLLPKLFDSFQKNLGKNAPRNLDSGNLAPRLP